MGVTTSEVGYTPATAGRGDHEVHKGHVVAKKNSGNYYRTYLKKVIKRVECRLKSGMIFSVVMVHAFFRFFGV
jgi:hypothetical protein